jgi:hypothetical protein
MSEFFHASIQKKKKGTAAKMDAYISRDKSRREDVKAVFEGNLPSGAGRREFWRAADEFERKGGVAFKSYVVALSRDVPMEQNIRAAEELARRLAGNRPFSGAVHCPRAALEGGDQPHAHLMISGRIPDGIDRPLKQFFRRPNDKDPGLGGCRKEVAPKTISLARVQRFGERQICADVLNETFAAAGLKRQVDAGRNEDRGLDAPKRPHLGPRRVRELNEH